MERDPKFGTDRVTSMLLDFGGVHLAGTCSTQMVPWQRIQIFGTRGQIDIRIPFNAPPDRACEVVIDSGKDLYGGGQELLTFPVCDQYTIQGDLFSKAVLEGTEPRAARGLDPQHGVHRGGVPIRGIGPMGTARSGRRAGLKVSAGSFERTPTRTATTCSFAWPSSSAFQSGRRSRRAGGA